MEQELEKLYYEVERPTAFGSLKTLHDAVKDRYARKDIAKWLSKQDAHTLHKSARRRFTRRKTYAHNPNDQWQLDLADLTFLSKDNDGYKFLLTCVDVFSRMAYVVPLKNKTGKATVAGLREIVRKAGVIANKIQTDKGGEFLNRDFRKFLADKNVTFFQTHNVETKAALVERFNRTLKNKMFKYLTANNTRKYIDVLDKLVESYNRSVHRTLGMRPIDVSAADVEDVWQKQYGKIGSAQRPKLTVGDAVRIVNVKSRLDKGYLPGWSEEYFLVDKILQTKPITYLLRDLLGEVLEGGFYEEEVQKISEPSTFHVDKVLKRKGRRLYVRWKGWPKKFDSWIDASLFKEGERF